MYLLSSIQLLRQCSDIQFPGMMLTYCTRTNVAYDNITWKPSYAISLQRWLSAKFPISHLWGGVLSLRVCEMCFVIYLVPVYQEQKWWENMFTIRVLSRLTALLTWAASLGWTRAVTCCNIYREYHAPTCSFYKIIRTSILLVPSFKLSFIWNATSSNYRIIWMAFFYQFWFILFNM